MMRQYPNSVTVTTIIAIALQSPQKSKILMTMVLVADMVTTVWTKAANAGRPAKDTLLVGHPVGKGVGWTRRAKSLVL
jgi:hypothetical protein